MGTIHCLTAFRTLRKESLTVDAPRNYGEVPMLEGVVQAFCPEAPATETRKESLRVISGAVVRYIVEVLRSNGQDVAADARFKLFGVLHGGMYRLMVRCSKVVDLVTGKSRSQLFVSSPHDLYPLSIDGESPVAKNNHKEHLLTLPLSKLYMV